MTPCPQDFSGDNQGWGWSGPQQDPMQTGMGGMAHSDPTQQTGMTGMSLADPMQQQQQSGMAPMPPDADLSMQQLGAMAPMPQTDAAPQKREPGTRSWNSDSGEDDLGQLDLNQQRDADGQLPARRALGRGRGRGRMMNTAFKLPVPKFQESPVVEDTPAPKPTAPAPAASAPPPAASSSAGSSPQRESSPVVSGSGGSGEAPSPPVPAAIEVEPPPSPSESASAVATQAPPAAQQPQQQTPLQQPSPQAAAASGKGRGRKGTNGGKVGGRGRGDGQAERGWENPATASASSTAAPAGWERSFKRDDELLRACGLYCKKVEADGACLFRAFSDQLEGDGGAGHVALRKKCVSFLEAHKTEFAPFVEGNFKTYCQRMRESAEWGGDMEITALSRTLGVNAMVHQPANAQSPEEMQSVAIEVVNFAEDAPCVQICFHPRYHAGPHYNSVRCVGDAGDGVPRPTTLTELRARLDRVGGGG